MSRIRAHAAAAFLAAACAQPAPPPGGPPDPVPPQLVAVSPDSGAVGARPDEVVFRFDEVIAERPQGVTTLEQLFVVSPQVGTVQARWRRTALGVRPAGGWRDSTTYVVQLLPGVVDLRGNVRDSSTTVVFSTGGPIPTTRIAGVVFDWAAGEPAAGALVQATLRADSLARDSVVYAVRTDSVGRFVLPYVPPGVIDVRGGIDANRNRGLDPREPVDTASVTLVDSAYVELYAFEPDTIGPRIAEVAVVDSVTLRVALGQPLAIDQPIDTALVRVVGPDSTPIAVASVRSQRAADSLRAAAADSAVRDSAAVAPPDSAARDSTARDSAVVAPPDTLAADSAATASPAAPPTMTRPVPVRALEVRLARPLAPETRYRVTVVNARGLGGATETSERVVTTPAPPAPPAVTPPPSSGPPGPPPLRPR